MRFPGADKSSSTLAKEFKLSADELFKSQEQIKFDESYHAIVPQGQEQEKLWIRHR